MNAKAQYCKYSLIAIILILGVIIFIRFTPFLNGILGALTIYILLRKQMFHLIEKKHMKRCLAATLMLGEAALCFFIPISLIVWLLVIKLQNINLNPQEYIQAIQHLADLIQQKTGYYLLNKENISFITSYLPKFGQLLVGNISHFIINIVVMLLMLFFMLMDGKKMEIFFYEMLPFTKSDKKDVLTSIKKIVRSNAIGIPLVATIQGGVAMIGYFIFGVPNPIFFGFLSCFASIIPVVGIGLVWAPLIAYLVLTGDLGHAVGLGAYSIIFTTNIDNLMRFILQKKLANIHPLITIFGVIIGLSLFGFMGIVFGPLMLSIFILCINIFKKEYLDREK
ncbi:AI-2E family transporter [uncultured Bacteroides sp.]|uniref:AI-2E family transporter n=1 Tax=uncultured Bacteroides sp. TaxID=162156 RepID=UPI002AAA6DF1|nr:AI-2E family transporter [uncultured Bacteroides sp.]